jgi:YegS/Rv2252/BmrU family lipid kinase
MKTVVIANPHAGNNRVGRRWADYHRSIVNIFAPSQIHLTTASGEATLLARRSILEGAERIIVVGGDGTMNEVVNGFFDNGKPIGHAVSLAICSAGTGGDFARSIGLSDRPLATAYNNAAERNVDVGKVSFINHAGQPETRYFLNIASFGSSGLVVKKVNHTSKRWGAKLSFFIGTLRGLWAYKNQRVRLRIDGHADKELVINTVAIANARYFGGGMMIAPDAMLDDGAFDAIIIGDVGLLTFLRNAPRLYRGTHLSLPDIFSFRGQRVDALPVGDTPVLLELDGELVGTLPARFENMPQALRLLAPATVNSAEDQRKNGV